MTLWFSSQSRATEAHFMRGWRGPGQMERPGWASLMGGGSTSMQVLVSWSHGAFMHGAEMDTCGKGPQPRAGTYGNSLCCIQDESTGEVP